MPLVSSRKLERLAGALAVLSLAMAALLLGRPWFTNASRPARGIGNAVIALEFARSVGEVDLILSDAPSPDREVMRFKQYLGFGFIFACAALFLVLAWMLLRQGGWGWAAGPAAMICAVATAAFGVLENRAILRLLDVSLYRTTPQLINAIRSASAAKWNMSALTLALLSTFFVRRAGWGPRLVGALLLATAAMEVYGLRSNRFLVWQAIPGLAALAGIAVLFFRVR